MMKRNDFLAEFMIAGLDQVVVEALHRPLIGVLVNQSFVLTEFLLTRLHCMLTSSTFANFANSVNLLKEVKVATPLNHLVFQVNMKNSSWSAKYV